LYLEKELYPVSVNFFWIAHVKFVKRMGLDSFGHWMLLIVYLVSSSYFLYLILFCILEQFKEKVEKGDANLQLPYKMDKGRIEETINSSSGTSYSIK